jgi:hypothetical protein
MKKDKIVEIAKITPDSLLNAAGVTPADNLPEFSTAVPWKSKLVGGQVRNIFDYQDMLKEISGQISVFGPWSIAASWQSSIIDTFITGPIKAQARMAVGSGRNPDLIGDTNGWIYKGYSRLLCTLTGFFIEDGKFSRQKALRISTMEKGHEFLRNYMEEFAQLEKSYSNVGLTRLAAMKELLKCLLVLITETPLAHEKLPFAKDNPDGTPALSFEDYLAETRLRLENLYRANAFDIKEYSERSTGGKIGFSAYEYVEGSLSHRVRLRYYNLPKGIKPNGKILYMTTPLINKPELFDLAQGKSVIEGMHKEGYRVYLIDYGDPGWEETELGLDFYGKTLHDHYLSIIKKRHPRTEIYVMAYCMGGTLMLPYLARRAEELMAAGKPMDIKKVALMASPVKFDDGESGHGAIRSLIRRDYDPLLMKELFGAVNIPPQVIEAGMNEIQPGVQYTVVSGFYGRALAWDAILDSAPFLYWLTHGTKFPVTAHIQWVRNVYMDNQIYEGKFCLPSSNPQFDGRPVNMDILRDADVAIFEYKGSRDPIAPAGSCVAAETWGRIGRGNIGLTGKALNRAIEKNIGHIFVVSRKHLSEYLTAVNEFYNA